MIAEPEPFVCQCPIAGHCATLKREQSPRQHAICRGTSDLPPEKADFYRGLWLAAVQPEPATMPELSAAELAKLTDGLDDPTLIGNRIAEVTKRFGIPPCGGCSARQQWLNKADKWVRGLFSPAAAPVRPEFVTTAQLTADVLELASRLPPKLAGIVGVARSGVLPATQLAMHLHLPLLILRESQNDIVDAGHGWRLGHHKPEGPLLVVDDTCMTGRSLRHSREVAAKVLPGHKLLWAVVYKNPAATIKPAIDFVGRDLPHPHLLEWNLFNSIFSPTMACDFDGILTIDGTTRPQYLPRKGTLPLIVTGRLERDRVHSIAWLARQGIKFGKLVMYPGTLAERDNPGALAAFKAEHFAASGLSYFVESDPAQAEGIAKLSNKPVICPVAGKVF